MGRRPLCVCLLFFLAGYLILYQFWKEPTQSGQQFKNGQQVELCGVVSEIYKPLKLSDDSVILYLKQVQNSKINHSFISVKDSKQKTKLNTLGAVCYLDSGQKPPHVGATVQITGTVQQFYEATNPGEFDQITYYKLRGYHFRVYQGTILQESENYDRIRQSLHELRQRTAEVFVFLLGQKNGALASAMVLGRKKDLEEGIKNLYQSAGISHILAISGLHISLVAGGIKKGLEGLRVPKTAVFLLAVGLTVLYGILTGMGVSTLRAILMFILAMTAGILRRTPDMPTSLVIAATYILIREPGYLQDSGFQLSFLAMVGLSLVVPVLKDRGNVWGQPFSVRKKITGIIWDALAVSLGVALAMMPGLLAHFYTWNPWSLLLNPMVVLLTGLLLPWLFGLAAAGLLWGSIPVMVPILRGLAYPAQFLFSCMETASELIQQLPGSCFHAGMPQIWQIVIFETGLLLLILWGKRIAPGLRMITAICLVMIFFWKAPARLQITMLDVGQGQCVVVQTPERQTFLLDAGSTSAEGAGKYTMVPYLKYIGANRIDGIFISHWDEDHVNGMDAILEWTNTERVKVGFLALPDIALADSALNQLLDKAAKYDIPVMRLHAGEVWEKKKCRFICLYPEKKETGENRNELSMMLKIEYGSFGALFPGDVSQAQERQVCSLFQEEILRCQVLAAGHHGSSTSSSEKFLKAVDPAIVLISCGVKNQYGHPHQEVLDRLETQKIPWITTADKGAVLVSVKEKQMRVTTFLQ